MEENFIRTYNNVLDDQIIDSLIHMYSELMIWDDSWHDRADKHRKDHQYVLELDPVNIQLVQHINTCLLRNMFTDYIKDFPYLTNISEWCSASTILQKTNPTEGYHSFHCENSTWHNQSRYLAWMVYLNDVEEGGETEFLYQKLRIKPRRNVGVVWPGAFTHLHRGNPPMETKYVLTGWFTPATQMVKFNMSDPNLAK